MPRASPKDKLWRRLLAAQQYSAGAALIECSLEDTGHSASILRLIAFEILLKAKILEANASVGRNHNYRILWTALPAETRDALISEAKRRKAGQVDFSDPGKLFAAWRKAFEEGRYSYEINDKRDAPRLHRLSESWDGKPETADFAFYPVELEALTEALEASLSSAM